LSDLAVQRHVHRGRRGAAVDSAAWLFGRPRDPADRVRRRARACAARQRSALREAETADRGRSRRARRAECGLMTLIGISIVLTILMVVLLAGGVWIGIALLATGWAGMQFAPGGIPAGSVLATQIWGNSASWELAALP